ncbi:MAG TPA: outer membrane beta-barrel protein [Burkholderiales bacterium]|nr:outer membrane beta-barrel protein [Burkholderiales bacterium]
MATLVLALCALPTMAADLDCQLGATAGAVYGRSQHVHSSGFEFTDPFNVNGRAAGVLFGCLAARNRLRYGAALDLMDASATGYQQDRPPNENFFSETSFDWIGTMRAVGGYQLDPRVTLYLTGGLAFSGVKIRVCAVSGAFAGTCGASSANVWGVVGGVGTQVRLWRRWSLSAEYLAFGFENKEFPTPVGPFADRGGGVQPQAQVFRAALNFHF